MEPEIYCREKAAPAGSSFYYATLFHAPVQKRRLHALFALHRELAETIDECQDPGVARMKLQWWSEELQRLYDNQARHPVSRELQVLLPELRLEQKVLLDLLKVMAARISPPGPESLLQLVQERTLGEGRYWQLVARAGGGKEDGPWELLASIGGHYHCLEHLLTAYQHLDRGYCPYPINEMEKHGLHEATLLQAQHARALGLLEDELLATLQSALTGLADQLQALAHDDSLFALVLARIAVRHCKLLRKRPMQPGHVPVAPTPLGKLWIAWRTKRRR